MRRRLTSLLARKTSVRETVAREHVACDLADAEVTATSQAQQTAQHIAEGVQRQAHAQIAGVVTRALATVFEDPYEFGIQFDRKRGKTEATLVFKREEEQYDPLRSCGGGVVDVAAFALRLSCLVLSRPPKRRLLVLDEPFRFVSVGYRARVRALIVELAKEMEVQIILVTHLPDIVAGKVVEIG